MATLQQSIKLNDGFTPILKSIHQAINLTLNGFEKMQQSTGESMNIKDFESARNIINDVGAEIKGAQEQQEQFNNKISEGNRKSGKLLNTVKRFIGVYAAGKAGKSFIDSADQYAGSQAKLKLINDGLQTTEELNEKIYRSAGRAKGNYMQMLDIVGKLGVTASKAFSNNDEMVYFSELMTKSFKVAGASAQEQSSAMYQLTQAMASGRLQGDEFRSIIENAPLLAQSIADEMGVTMGKLKEMSSDGLITSDVIKAALFNSADKINSKFAEMPAKFSDVMTSIKNNLLLNLQPAFQKFSNFLNSDTGQKFFTNIGKGLMTAVNIASRFLDIIVWIATIFTENWSFIAPVLFTILTPLLLLKGATLALNAVMLISNGIKAISAGITTALSIAQGTATAATITATTAQWGFNTALLACPLTWILLIIIAVIGVIFLIIKALNHFGISTNEIIGSAVGCFNSFWAVVQNIFIHLNNVIGSFVNFFKNVFKDPVGAVKMLFYDLSAQIIGFVLKIAEALERLVNKIPGVNVNMTKGLNDMLDKISEAQQRLEDETGVKAFKPMEFKSVTDAYDNGFQVGSDAWDNISSMFDKDKTMDNLFPDTDPMGGFNIDKIDRVDSLGSIDDDVDISSEDLKTMRELAEMKAIQNFVTLTPTVTMSTGDINNGYEFDEIVERITTSLEEEVATGAKGAYDV